MGIYEDTYNKIRERLDSLRNKIKKLSLATGSLMFLIITIALILTALSSEAVFYFNSSARLFIIICLFLLELCAFIWLVFRPLYSLFFQPNSPDDINLALKVGRHFTSIRDRLADALQVFQKHKNNPEGYSLELTDASLALIDQEVKDLNFTAVADTRPTIKILKFWIGSFIVFLLCFLFFSNTFINASNRLINPRQTFAKKPGLTFSVSPGNADVVKGDNVHIQATVSGAEVSAINFALKKVTAKDFETHALTANPENQFSFTIENIKDDIEYFIESENQNSEKYIISVVELPFIRSLHVKLTYPRYSKLGSQLLDENVGDVSALKGSIVEVSAATNKTVKDAKILFDDDKNIPLNVSGQEVSGKFTLLRSGDYHFNLIDKENRENASPIEYRMTVLEDQFPFVQITFPGQDVDLGDDMLLPLTIEAQDDFGFSQVRLGYKILHGGLQEGELQFLNLELPKENGDNILLNHTWELSKMEIFPEDIITYYAEVFDNDKISGPKSSKSLIYRVRFPSIYEIYDEIARGHEETFEGLEEMYEQSKSLRDNLQEIVQEMKREPELKWEEQQKVQEAVQAQEKMRQDLQEIQDKLDEMVSRMEQNDLLSNETLQKYQELQKLMEEMLTPELQEALRELQKSFEDIDPEKLKEAMEKFSASQEDFLKSVERTLNLLKKLQIEQKLDQAVRKAQDLLRRQEELNAQAKNVQNKESGSKYAQEEKGIQRDTENLSQDLEDIKNLMSDFPKMPQNRIEAAQNEIDNNGLQSKMQNTAQQFQSGNMQGAQKSGQQISQNLQELVETLQTAQKELSDEQKQEIMQQLSRSSYDLLNLSKQQENLMNSTKGMDRNSPGMNESADKQQDMLGGLSRVTNQLYELSQKTFFVTPEIGKALGKSAQGMQESLQSLEARKSGSSVSNQGKAMSGLNEAVSQLRQSMQNLSGASSAIGFQEMMQRLMGMSNKQQGINKQTSGMGEKPGMSMEEQAAMARLAAEQGALRKSLEQLLKEMGNRSELLGDLEKVSQDMEEVVKDFQKQNVNRSTINRQKQILSRLLDAQRSMHNREYSKKRQAETGKEYHALSPDALPSSLLSKKDRLKNELLKAMKEGYSKDYRELIRKYFEALNREKFEETLNN